MKRQLKFVTCCPIDNYFTWQVHLWLESLRDLGHSDKAVVLIFKPIGRENPKWQQVMDLYPEASFHIYQDDGSVYPFLGTYIPILRLYLMKRYCHDHPEVKDKAVFYCDSDILFMKGFSLDHLLEDEIVYGSDTNSYISASYFDSKVRDVLPERLEEYKKIDVLDEAARMVGIDRAICEHNNLHSIGTQYLLKNTDEAFWASIMEKCIPLYLYLRGINQRFFPGENQGYQSWTTDMWLVLWELWRRGQETRIVPELAFAWATDAIERLQERSIFHNAGVSSEWMGDTPYFYKGKYHQGADPTEDPHLDVVINDPRSQHLCTSFYARKLRKLKAKYNLSYSL